MGMTGKYELILTSYVGCDDFVVEVWLQDNLIAVLKENGEIQLFEYVSDKTFFESCEFATIIAEAKEKLGIE